MVVVHLPIRVWCLLAVAYVLCVKCLAVWSEKEHLFVSNVPWWRREETVDFMFPQWCNSWELVRFRANTTHRRRSLYGQDWSKLFQISLICRQSHLKLRNEKLFDRNSFLQIFKVVVVSFICTRHLEALKRNLWHDIFLYLKIICSVYVLGSIIKLIPKAVTSFFAHFARRRHRKIRIIVHKM